MPNWPSYEPGYKIISGKKLDSPTKFVPKRVLWRNFRSDIPQFWNNIYTSVLCGDLCLLRLNIKDFFLLE